MKVIILAAGHKAIAPKCLYNYRGEILLERQVRTLRELGLNNIRIVLGCKKEKVEKFIKNHNLNIEIMYNDVEDLWSQKGQLYSLKIGMEQ